MDAGKLDRRITVKRATSSVNGFNEPIYSWSTLVTLWSGVTPVNDAERTRAGETLAQIQCRFVIRWSATAATIDPRDRLVFDRREFDINGVKEIKRRRYLEITATARADT